MPSLSNEPVIEKINLNGYSADDPAWVEIDTQPMVGDEVDTVDSATDGLAAIRAILANRIKSWNLTVKDAATGDEVIAPVSIEMVKKLRQAAFLQLSELMEGTVEGLSSQEKKSSSDTSPASATT